MKTIKYLTIMLFIFSIYSCKEEHNDISEKIISAYLYNSYNINDTFKMLRVDTNSADTLTFTVVQKDLEYIKESNFNKVYNQYLIMAYTCDKEILGDVKKYNSGGVYITQEQKLLMLNEFVVSEIELENDTATVLGKYYDNLYKLSDGMGNTFALTSKESGIVKVWRDSVAYLRLP